MTGANRGGLALPAPSEGPPADVVMVEPDVYSAVLGLSTDCGGSMSMELAVHPGSMELTSVAIWEAMAACATALGWLLHQFS